MEKILKKILIVELILLFTLFLLIKFDSFPSLDIIEDIIEKPDDNQTIYKETEIDEGSDLIEIIKNGLLEGKESIEIPERLLNGERDGFFDIVKEILLNNPEIMYYSGGKYSNNIFYPEYSKAVAEKQSDQEFVKAKRDEIVSQIINPNMSEYDMVKAVHDYIVDNTKYDTRYFSDGKVPPESNDVYGVLSEGIAVCEGYARTMKYLLDKIGIENYIVLGVANGENHAWNMVNIQGEYYHIDATWDDPITEDGSNLLIYDYFNLKDSDMEKTHTWDKDEYPKCNSDTYNYYSYNNLVAYDYDDFYNKILWALVNKQNEIAIKVVNFQESEYDIPTVINQIAKTRPNIIKSNRYSYSINKFHGIIRICFY